MSKMILAIPHNLLTWADPAAAYATPSLRRALAQRLGSPLEEHDHILVG
jgi:hypothetical protein